MVTSVMIVKQMSEWMNSSLDKFIWTISYLSWMWTEPDEKSDNVMSIDEVPEKELITALKKEINEYDDN